MNKRITYNTYVKKNDIGIDDAIWAFAFWGATSNAVLAGKSGKSPWKGALVGGLSSIATNGIGNLFGHSVGNLGNELLRAGAHGLSSGAQMLHVGSDGVSAAASLSGGLASLATGGKFMDGYRIGMSVGAYNHNGGKKGPEIDGGSLPPVFVVADDLSYRNTFGYWLLGSGSGASSGPYGMWNPDAVSLSVGGNIQLGPFHLGGDVGLIMGAGELYPYVNYNAGVEVASWSFSASCSANVNMYINNSNKPFSLSSLEGYGYNVGANLLGVSLDYGTGVDWLGLPTTAQYESFGIGIGPGLGVYGNSSTTQYLIHY